MEAPCFSNMGGGSHIWAAMMDTPDAGFWEDRAEGLSDDVMAPHYARCATELQAVQPEDSAEVPGHTDHAWSDEVFSRL